MARSNTTFKKGIAKGKPKGALNKTTKLTKELIELVLCNRKDDINDALDLLKEDPAKFIDAISKLLPYILPKLASSELTGAGGKDLNAPVIIFQDISGKEIK